ncbi:hypothetical protein LMG28614_00723 [Paraburkholderia ultramafica]|uniref:Uncharacterized protein n=1 Tax=Paraburkholderia ultramafica TaxID=1544867 RepID=A0A6S7AUZ2_9BURK|nr:hypothetical protein LMG28614_00723 [Paraburkholderia ultramafica]
MIIASAAPRTFRGQHVNIPLQKVMRDVHTSVAPLKHAPLAVVPSAPAGFYQIPGKV